MEPLWFGDWANALIGHMQYSQRDPNRDHTRGRIYRLVYPERPLVEPVTQFGKPVPELLDQLRQYEWRTRYRARRELRDRPSDEVVTAVKTWVSAARPEGFRVRAAPVRGALDLAVASLVGCRAVDRGSQEVAGVRGAGRRGPDPHRRSGVVPPRRSTCCWPPPRTSTLGFGPRWRVVSVCSPIPRRSRRSWQ